MSKRFKRVAAILILGFATIIVLAFEGFLNSPTSVHASSDHKITNMIEDFPFARNIKLEEKTIMLNKKKVNYLISGNGPFLLMLHGYTLSGKLWEPFIEKLSKDFTLIIPDLPGHGSSSPVDGEYSFEKFADIMIQFLYKIGIEGIYAVGHSGGAMTILNMIKKKPETIKSMILIGCTHKFSEKGIKFAQKDTFENLSKQLKEFYRGLHPGRDSQTKKLFDQMMPLLNSYNNFDIFSEEFSNPERRTMIVLGDNDNYFKPEYAVEMYRTFPDSKLWIIPGQGHLPFRKDWGGSALVEKIFPEIIKNFFLTKKDEVKSGLE